MPLLENFVDNIRRRFDDAEVSKSDIARKAGIHRVTIHKILAGKIDPSIEMCERIAVALGFSPAENIFKKNSQMRRKTR
jgi:DNA-binding XRE family transcriptional regulator